MEKNDYKLISVIVNKGYAEDAMAAARKAGAKGGTILGARGTANENDARFFGVKLVPEKELLLILAPNDVADAVFEAVRALPCFAEKGSGIEFAVPVRDFALLGR
jgi:nitrogen regulatory protein PII